MEIVFLRLEQESGLSRANSYREIYILHQTQSNHIRYLESYSFGKPYLHVLNIDPGEPEHFDGWKKIRQPH